MAGSATITSAKGPETIEQYSIRVVEAWKLGKKGVDNGLLLLVAKDDHKVRIEVGYGLEGDLNGGCCLNDLGDRYCRSSVLVKPSRCWPQ